MREFMWSPDPRAGEADSYVAFRGQFDLKNGAEIDVKTLGAAWYGLWVDGEYINDGPARFPMQHPQYQSTRHALVAGHHTIAVLLHHEGLQTRMLDNVPPFLWCKVLDDGRELPLEWKCVLLEGYEQQVKRINPQLGWIECCDTRKTPKDWQATDFNDASWSSPKICSYNLGTPEPLTTATVLQIIHESKPIAQGLLAESFGYEKDNIAARFFLRNLEADQYEAQGVWRRYDLGQIRLMRPRFVLDLHPGACVQFAYSEYLVHGRVSPWITLSAGDSCNFDHYVARGGVQEFFPLTPKGGRFAEIHIIYPHGSPDLKSDPFIKEEFLERCYYGSPEGSFECSDPLLNRIWAVGIETHRACAEDALVDNPTRERGQWAGDVVAVGMDVAAAGYSDLRLFRRALVQFAQCAREDGLVSGLCPGGNTYMSSYAAQWVSACVHYWTLTGDRSILEDLFPAAANNIEAFRKYTIADGVTDEIGVAFTDWGYVRNPGPVDIALNLHHLAALRDMQSWCRALGKEDRTNYYQLLDQELSSAISRWFAKQQDGGKTNWEAIGYHRAVLGLKLGFFSEPVEDRCLGFIKEHILRCFPNKIDAPRLSDPDVASTQIITPYFFHFAMPVLIERGEIDFALDMIRKCWGWMLDTGATTWPEVFDTRWSHCHQWSDCPTWQLSRYILGLTPRFDLGQLHYEFRLKPVGLASAQGLIPLPDGRGCVSVKWHAVEDGIHYSVETPEPIYLWLPEADKPFKVERNISGFATKKLASLTFDYSIPS